MKSALGIAFTAVSLLASAAGLDMHRNDEWRSVPVDCVRLEGPLDLFCQYSSVCILRCKTDSRFSQAACSGIGSHDDDYISEIRFSSLVIRQGCVIHYLKKDVIDVTV